MRAKYLDSNPRREPSDIGEILGRVIEKAAVGVDVRQADVVARWNDFVPPDWTQGHPVGVREGVLLVEVSDGAIASILRYQIEPLMRAITDEFGTGLVTAIRVKIRSR